MMQEGDLTSAWDEVLEWLAFGLMKEGYEGIICHPLGKFPKSSTFLSRATFSNDDFHYRKVAASLAGWINEPELNMLTDFFSSESRRDSSLPENDLGRLECQSVVEDIVFSAARWARMKKTQTAALDLLKTIVQRTIDGEYWNTSSYAMATICRYVPPYANDLLQAFHEFAHHGKAEHPSNPSLTQERTYSEGLINGNKEVLDSIENVLIAKDKAARAKVGNEDQPLIDNLLRVAKLFEK
jgi:hypothetical protein